VYCVVVWQCVIGMVCVLCGGVAARHRYDDLYLPGLHVYNIIIISRHDNIRIYIYIYIHMPLSRYDKSSISVELAFKKQCPKFTANSFMETKCSLPYSQQLTIRLSSVSHCHASTLHKTSFNITLPWLIFPSEISRQKVCRLF